MTDRFYTSAPWRKTRAALLDARPACVTPGCGRPATHVDHIVALRAGGAALDAANLQPLCHSCHSRETALHDGGFGHRGRTGKQTPATLGCDAAGWPLAAAAPVHALDGRAASRPRLRASAGRYGGVGGFPARPATPPEPYAGLNLEAEG